MDAIPCARHAVLHKPIDGLMHHIHLDINVPFPQFAAGRPPICTRHDGRCTAERVTHFTLRKSWMPGT
jgi:hypothetical protein